MFSLSQISTNLFKTRYGGCDYQNQPESAGANKKAKNLLDWEPKTNLESWIKKYKNE